VSLYIVFRRILYWSIPVDDVYAGIITDVKLSKYTRGRH